MSERLLFVDSDSAADALTFAGRAARLTEDAVRLQAAGGVLAMSTPSLVPRGLLDETPTILGMRTLAVDPELVCDIVVRAGELARDASNPAAILLPPIGLTAAWAGVSAPRGAWIPRAELAASLLAARARWGIAAVAEAVPRDAGEEVVRAVRGDIWGRPDDELAGVPLGVAFTAVTLGFIAGEEVAAVRTNGPWTRVSLARGDVLTRRQTGVGLTPVRATGRPQG